METETETEMETEMETETETEMETETETGMEMARAAICPRTGASGGPKISAWGMRR
jgi:hypothetical protein